jgi:hypothetical protein
MALQTRASFWCPERRAVSAEGGFGAFTSYLMDASAEKVAFVFRAPKTGTLDSVGFKLGTVTQAPTNGLKVSFQDVSAADGHPDGVADQYATVTAGLTSNSWVDVSSTGYMGSTGAGSGSKRSVTVGDLLAVVIEYASFSASDSLNIDAVANDSRMGVNGQAYISHFTAAWSKLATGQPTVALKYDDGSYSYAPGFFPAVTLTTVSFASNDATADENGLIFQVPFPCKVSGAWVATRLLGDCDLVLYDDSSVAQRTVSMDTDQAFTSAVNVTVAQFADYQLAANTTYRLVLKPTTTTAINLLYFTVNAAAILDQLSGGQTFHWTQRVDAGAWTQTTTKRPMMGLFFTAFDDATGGGGGGGPLISGRLVR